MNCRIQPMLASLASLAWIVLAQPAAASPLAREILAVAVSLAQPSSLDLPPEEAEEAPVTPPAGGLDQEEAPLNAPAPSGGSSGARAPYFDGDESSDEQPKVPVCDVVWATGSDGRSQPRPWNIKLLVKPFEPLRRGETVEFDALNRNGQGTTKFRATKVTKVEYYEERVLALAAAEFGITPAELARPNSPLAEGQASKLARVQAILKKGLAEHDSAVQRYLRKGEEWNQKVRLPLVRAILNIEAFAIRQLVAGGDFEKAAAACDRIRAQHQDGAVGNVELRELYESIFLGQAAKVAYAGEDFKTVRENLAAYTSRYPLSPGDRADRLRKTLIGQAQSLVDQAGAEGDAPAKVILLERAAKIWPQLIGLDKQLREVQEEYPVLECAYATLPHNLSPLSASTPVERHAVALMFEGLVQWTEQSPAGPHYASQLAAARPVPLAKGRQFKLPQCVWTDSESDTPHFCTAEDVRWTVKLLKTLHPTGFPPAWDRLIQEADSHGGDPFAVRVQLQADHWQPLSLMDFAIVPKAAFPTGGQNAAELKAFSEKPVGTGPFALLDREADRVRFQANPYYRKPGLPHIREIVFNRLNPTEAVEQFRQDRIHLIYDLGREQVDLLEKEGRTVVALPARSVYFLAPNYRRESILQRENVRLAIAHVINRKQILDQFFRPGQHPTRHAELNGPFPADCWACDPQAPKFDPAQAPLKLGADDKDAIAQSRRPLRLVYPGRDTPTEQACQEIAKQVRTLGIELELEAVEPDKFHAQIVNEHSFDLAYWRHEFKDESYYIWPLFDPADAERGGANFMGFTPSEGLSAAFLDMKNHKEFSRVRDLARQTHVQINRTAGIIPLWQLETHVAVSPLLQNAVFDSVDLFAGIENWRLTPARRTPR